MASLIPLLFGAGAAGAAGAGTAAGAAAAPTAATLGAAAAPAAAYGAGVAAPAVTAATPALASAAATPALTSTLAGAAAAPAFGNNLGISYAQLNQLANSRGNAKDFAPFANSLYQQRQPQVGQIQGLPASAEAKDPDTLDNMLNFFRNIGSM